MDITPGKISQGSDKRKYYINFDEWSNLAANDPDRFELKRKDLLNDFLSQFPESRQQRLRGLQFRIDMERRRAKTPMGACIRLSHMMWDSIEGENGLLDSLKLLTTDIPLPKKSFCEVADVIPFPSSPTRNN